MNPSILKTFLKCFCGSLLLGTVILLITTFSKACWTVLVTLYNVIILIGREIFIVPAKIALLNPPIILILYSILTFSFICFYFKISPSMNTKEEHTVLAQKHNIELSTLYKFQSFSGWASLICCYLLVFGGFGVLSANTLYTESSDVVKEMANHVSQSTMLDISGSNCVLLLSPSNTRIFEKNSLKVTEINGKSVSGLSSTDMAKQCIYNWDNDLKIVDTSYKKKD